MAPTLCRAISTGWTAWEVHAKGAVKTWCGLWKRTYNFLFTCNKRWYA